MELLYASVGHVYVMRGKQSCDSHDIHVYDMCFPCPDDRRVLPPRCEVPGDPPYQEQGGGGEVGPINPQPCYARYHQKVREG